MTVRHWHPLSGLGGALLVPDARRLTTNHGELMIRDGGGSGTPLLLLHGWCADGLLNWARAFVPLADSGFRPIAIDLPGHGGSSLAEPFSLTLCTKAVSSVQDQLGLDSSYIAGYSMGGPVSQLLARDAPGRVAGLIQIATAAQVIATPASRFGMRLLSGVWEAGAISQKAVALALRAGSADPDCSSLLAHAGYLARRVDQRALGSAARQLADFDSQPWVGNLRLPAVSMVTGKDRAVPPPAQLRLAELLGAAVDPLNLGHTACIDASFGPRVAAAAQKVLQVTILS